LEHVQNGAQLKCRTTNYRKCENVDKITENEELILPLLTTPTRVRCAPGLPDFSWSKHNKTEKYTKLTQTIPKSCKLYQMVVKYSKRPYYITIISIPRPSKFYQTWYFWFENKTIWQPWCARQFSGVIQVVLG
jgi:hypothetical protein